MDSAFTAIDNVRKALLSSFLVFYGFYVFVLLVLFFFTVGPKALMNVFTLQHVVNALIWILPAYVANGSPVVIGKFFLSKNIKRHPIDFNKRFFDGREIFGKNKTFEGFLGGLAAGCLASLILQYMGLHDLALGCLLALGALLGDLVGAFIKRRIGIKPGDPAWILDQVDFLIGSFILQFIFFGDLDMGLAFIAMVITPLIHILTNFAAYLLKLKNVPW